MKSTQLYSVSFPLWMITLFPEMWLIVLPLSFVIDSLVLIIGIHILKIKNKALIYQKCILKVFFWGFLADAIGSGLTWTALRLGISLNEDSLYTAILALIIASVLIFIFNYFFSFKKLSKQNRFKLALTFAIVTAPYMFLIPATTIH